MAGKPADKDLSFAFREMRKSLQMPKLPNRQPVLKPQDFYLLLVLVACRGRGTTYPELAALPACPCRRCTVR